MKVLTVFAFSAHPHVSASSVESFAAVTGFLLGCHAAVV